MREVVEDSDIQNQHLLDRISELEKELSHSGINNSAEIETSPIKNGSPSPISSPISSPEKKEKKKRLGGLFSSKSKT